MKRTPALLTALIVLAAPGPGSTLGHMVGMEVHDVQKNFAA
jgi:hypothetical protein